MLYSSKLFLFWTLRLLLPAVMAFHNGAPCSTQYTMAPSAIFHGVPQNPGPRPPPFHFEVADAKGNQVAKYNKGQVYIVKIKGVKASFRGILLQARPATTEGHPIGHLRAGTFIPDSTWALQGVKYQPCPGVSNDSLTHAGNDDKSMLEIKWTSTINHGPILFVITIVQNRTLFWTQWIPSTGFLLPEEDVGDVAGEENTEGTAGKKSPVEGSATEPEGEAKTTISNSETESDIQIEATVPTNATASLPAGKVRVHNKQNKKPKTATAASVEVTEIESSKEVPTTKSVPDSLELTSTDATTPRIVHVAFPIGKIRGLSERLRKKSKTTTTASSIEATEAESSSEFSNPENSSESLELSNSTEASSPRPPAANESRPDRLLPAPDVSTASGDGASAEEERGNSPSAEVDREETKEGSKGSGLEAAPASSEESLAVTAEANGTTLSPFGSSPAVAPDTEEGFSLPASFLGNGSKLFENLPPASPVESEGSSELNQTDVERPLPPQSQPSGEEPPQLSLANPALAPGPEATEAADYCAEKPCANNGTCISVPEDERYQCKCPRNWTGPQCAAPNLCVSHNCKNGAQCVNGEDRYTCRCRRGWGGDLCDKSCPPDLCQNGGTCTVSGSEKPTYSCVCPPGWTGESCQTEIKHCDSNPCLNGAKCVNKFNAFECKCKDGYMGETCYRPCQDIYHSCDFWEEQEKCESQRPNTKWFDVNCAHTCGQCKYDNHSVTKNVTLPPVLEPFEFILGRWTLNSTTKNRFPIDFVHNNTEGYFEELVFSITEVPQFGPPSINFSAVAVNNLNQEDVMVSLGFLTVRPATTPLKTFLMSTGNDGVTVVEEGNTTGPLISLSAQYFAILLDVDDAAPATAKRTFSIANQYLKMDVERTINNGKKDYFTSYYWRDEQFRSF